MKYVRVMEGNKSNAGGFELKLNEVNTSNHWNPTKEEPSQMGGFNFSTEEKVLRWTHRGDTLYDVEIPEDAEIIECSSINCPHGVFRSNKIILSNPRPLTNDLLIDLYKKSDLPEKTYYQCIVVLLFRYRLEAAKYIVRDRINKSNVDDCIKEFERYISDTRDNEYHEFNYDELWDDAKVIYDLLLEIKGE